MADAYKKLKKAQETGNADKINDEAGRLTRWANAYQGTQHGKLAGTNEALVQGFGSADAVKEMVRIVRQVNSGKGAYKPIKQDIYSVKAFEKMARTIEAAEKNFRMDMSRFVSEDYLKTAGVRSGKPTDVQAAEVRAAEASKGRPIDLNAHRQGKAEKVSGEALQYRIDEIENELDRVIDEYINGKAKSMDQAIQRVFSRDDKLKGVKNKRAKVLSDYEQRKRITGDKSRYDEEYFRLVTPQKGEKTLAQQNLHWRKAAYTDKYVKEQNQKYAAHLKAQGMDKVDLSMAPENFDLPQQLKGVLEEAYMLRRQKVQDFIDAVVKKAEEEDKTLEQVLSQMSKEGRIQLDQKYGQFLGLGGNKDRYKTLGGDLPLDKYTSPQNRNYWSLGKKGSKKRSGLLSPSFQRTIQEELDVEEKKARQEERESLQRQIKRGQHFVKPKTAKTSQYEDQVYMSELVQSEIERIAKEYIPTGNTGTEERRDQLEQKLRAAFEAAKKANQQGREFSVSGAYGVGNDAKMRSDYYEWLALGGDRSKVSWGKVNPFEAEYFNAIMEGGSTQDVKNYWRRQYQDTSPEGVRRKQSRDKQFEYVYSQRLADQQAAEEETARATEQAQKAEKQVAEQKKSNAQRYKEILLRRQARDAKEENEEKKVQQKKEQARQEQASTAETQKEQAREAVPTIPPREKRKQDLQRELLENADKVTAKDKQLLSKWNQYKALGGDQMAIKNSAGKNPYSTTWTRGEMGKSWQEWNARVKTPEYAKSIGEQTQAIQQENQALKQNNQLKQENTAKSKEASSASQKSTESKKAELKSDEELQAQTKAAIERRKKQLADSLATANFERELGLKSQGNLIGQKSNDYFEYKALGGDLQQLKKYGAKKNYFDIMNPDLKKRMEDKWSSKVQSEDYLSALREQNAALDENTAKVQQNQAAKQASAAETEKQTERARELRKAELEEDLKRMVQQTRERASDIGGNMHSQFNDVQNESGYGGSIESDISQLEHLQDQQDEVIEKWNELRALGGTAEEILGDGASEKDIEALNNLDNSALIQSYKEQHGLAEQAVEDAKKVAEAQKEVGDAQREVAAARGQSKTAQQDDKASAEEAEKTAEAYKKQAEARREANEEAAKTPAVTEQKASAQQAERAAQSAERKAKAEQEAAKARQQAKTVQLDQDRAGTDGSINAQREAINGLAGELRGEIVQAVNAKNEAFRSEQEIVTGVVEAEKAEFMGLAEAIQTTIPQAIDIKNASFQAEQDIVTNMVATEKQELTSLAQEISSTIPDSINKMGDAMRNQQSQFTSSVDNIKTIVTELCDTLTQISTAAETISGANFDKLGNIVKPLKTFKVGENASANLQNFSNKVQKSTSDLSKYSKKTTVDTSSLTSMSDAVKGFKVSKDASSNLQAFITQIKAIKRTLKSLGSMDTESIDNVSKLTSSVSNLKVGKNISTNLQNLITPLEQLQGALTKLASADIDVNALNNVFSALTNFKPNKNIGDRIKSLSDALKPLRESLESFKDFDGSQMDRITAFLAQAGNLKDLATVLKASAKNVQAAKDKIDIASGAKTADQVSQEQKQAEKKTYTSDLEGGLSRSAAVRQYTKNIQQFLVLQQKLKSMQEHGVKIPQDLINRREQLQKLIKATEDYIDVQKGEYIQAKAQSQNAANTQKNRSVLVQQKVEQARTQAEQMKAAYDQIYTQLSDPTSLMGQSQVRLKNLQSSNIQGISGKMEILRQEVSRLNESFALGASSEQAYADGIDNLLKPYEKASAILSKMDRQDVQARMRQNLMAAASQRGVPVQEGDVRFSGTNNMKASVKVVNKKGQTEILTQQYDAQTEALSKMSSMYATTTGSVDKFFSSLKTHGRSLVTYLATFASFYRVVGVLKQIIGQIKEYDTALTQMRKVSDESIDRLKYFQQQSFDISGQIGSTALQIQQSTADFLRLGQQFDQAKESAKNANILFNVSEFDSIDDATTSLIAMTQAYKDVQQTHIIDSLNKVGNDFSISTSGLAEALQRSASALTTSGNSLEESIGMITAANQVVQNPENVGAAMKIISLRLAGQKQQIEDMGEDTEGMVTTVSKLKTGIMNATKVASNGMKGVNIEDTNGNLKNTYSILQEIADIWEQIGDQDKINGTNQQNYLLETMAGKNRSNVLASLLQSPDILRNAYNEALDSEGSAMIENQKYLESVEGHMKQLKNEASEFAYNFMSSDGLKGIIDLGTQFLKLINDISSAIGSIPTLGAILTGGMGVKSIIGAFRQAKGVANVDQQVTGIQDIIRNQVTSETDPKAIAKLVKGNDFYEQFTRSNLSTIAKTVEQATGNAALRNAVQLELSINRVGQAAEDATTPVVGFGSVLKSAFSGANLLPTLTTIASLVVTVGSAIYNAYKKAKEARIQNASEQAGQYKDVVSDIDSQINNYTRLQESLSKSNITEQESARIKSQLLSLQSQISESYGKQAQNIDLVNGSLDQQVEKLQQIKIEKAKSALAQAGARGQSKGDFKDSYNEMTREYTFHPGKQQYVEEPNVSGGFDIWGGKGLDQIFEWAKKFEEQGLVVDSYGLLNTKKMTATGTAKEILDLLKNMGDDLENIPDYDQIKDSGNFETLQNWINDATQHFSGIVRDNEDNFLQYLNMKLLSDERHGIDYSYKGANVSNGSLGSFYFKFQESADAYAKALKGSDDEAIQSAETAYQTMRQAWSDKIQEMHKNGDSALDDYQLLMDGITDSINIQDINAHNLAKDFKSKEGTRLTKQAKKITESGLSLEDFQSAAKSEGIQRGEYYVNRVLSQALQAGYITDIKDTGQIDWLIGELNKLGVFGENAAKTANKAEGTFASFLNTVADSQNNQTFSDLIDNIQSTSSSLDDWNTKFENGEVNEAGLSDLMQEFPDLASDAQFLQTITDNMNADGFVEYTSDIKRGLSDLNFKSAVNNIKKINEELSDPDSYTDAQRAIISSQRDLLINQLGLSNVSAKELNRQIYGGDFQFNKEDKQSIKQLLRNTVFENENGAEIVARLLLDDQAATWDFEQWKSQIENEGIEIDLKANVEAFKDSIESTRDMMTKNAKLTAFEESLDNGKASAEDLLELVNSYPAEFKGISSTISGILSSENIDGTINGAKELSDVLSHLRVDNLEKSLINAQNDIEKIIAYSQADLRGISAEDATRLLSSDTRNYDVAGKTKEDLLSIIQTGSEVERQAAVMAYGMQISFTDAIDVVQNQLEKAAVESIKTFDAVVSSVDSFKQKAATDSVTSDDVLGLVETFPEILQYTDILGQAFSDLTLTGVLSDASKLEQILTQIEANKLIDLLDKNNITDQSIVQGMANQIDFSSISEGRARVYKKWLQSQYGADLSDIDEGTEEGRDIIGHVKFVYDHASVTDGQKVIEDSTAQATSNGLKNAMSDVKALDSAFSTFDDYAEKALTGQLQASDLDSIYESFGDLITDGDQLNALYGSLNMDNFVSDAKTANALINDLKIAKIQKFVKEQGQSDAITKAAQRSLVDQTRFTGVTVEQAREAKKKLQKKGLVNQGDIDTLFAQGKYSAILRLSMYPQFENKQEFYESVKSAVEGYFNDIEFQLKAGVDIVSGINENNSAIDGFTEKLQNSEATVEDVVSLMKDVPKAASEAGDVLSNLLSNQNADGTLKNLEGVDEVLAHLKYENLKKGIESLEELRGSTEVEGLSDDQITLLRKSAMAAADLSGISAEDAAELVNNYADGNKQLLKMIDNQDTLANEAVAKAALLGTSYEQAYKQIEAREEKQKVAAVQNFQSMANEIASFSEKVFAEQATSEDVLGLVETFPELLNQTDVLSDAFSQLNLNQAITDASALQALLESIAQTKLKDVLDENGIVDPNVIMGLANTLDFSHTDKKKAQSTLDYLKDNGVDVSGIDINTEQGLDILGNIQYVVDNAEGENLSEVTENAVNNGAKKGLDKAIAQVKDLSDNMSTLSGMSDSLLSGTFSTDNVTSLMETGLSKLKLSGEQVNAIYSSINMDGLVEDTQQANDLVNKLKRRELKSFFKQNGMLSRQAQQAILNSTRFTGVDETQGMRAYKRLQKRAEKGEAIDMAEVDRLRDLGNFTAIARLQVIPKYNGEDDFWSGVQDAMEASTKDKKYEFQSEFEVLSNLSTKNKGYAEFIDQVADGTATVDGLFSLIQEIPEIAIYSGDALAKMFDSAEFGQIKTGIDGIQDAANSFTLKNLEEQFKQIDKVTENSALRSALRGYMLDQADLSGTSFMEALSKVQTIDDASLRKEVQESFRKGEFTAEAIMRVILRGDVDASDVEQKIMEEQMNISRRDMTADVNARLNFNSEMSSIQGVLDEIATGDATVDSVLSLSQSMPEILEMASAIGYEFADMNMDGILDDAERMKIILTNVQANKLMKLIENDRVSRIGKLSSIANTNLASMTMAQAEKMLGGASALVTQGLGDAVTREAAVKAKLSLDASGVDADAENYAQLFQNAMDGYVIDISIRTSIEDSQKALDEIGAINEQLNSAAAGQSVDVETYNLQELKDYKSTLELTSNAIHYNAGRVRQLNKAKAEEAKASNDAAKAIEEARYLDNAKQIAELTDKLEANAFAEGENAESVQAHINKLLSDNSVIQDNISTLNLLNAAIDEAISKYQQWKNAQGAPQSGDMFDDTLTMYQQISDLFDPESDTYDKFGNEDSQSAIDFLLPDDFGDWKADPQKVKEWQNNTLKQFYTFDENGKVKGFNMAAFFDKMVENGFAEVDENGNYQMLGEHTMEEIAKGLNVGTGFVEAAFGEINEYIPRAEDQFRFENDSFANLAEDAGKAKNAIDTIDGTTVDIDISGLETDDAMTKLNATIAQMQEKKLELDPEVDTTEIQQANTIIAYCVAQMQKLNEPVVMKVDTTSLPQSSQDDGTAQAISDVQQLVTATNEKEQLVAIGADTSEADEKINELVGKINGEQDAMLNIGITVDGETDLNNILEQINKQDEEVYLNIGAKLVENPKDELQDLKHFKIDDKEFSVSASGIEETAKDIDTLNRMDLQPKTLMVFSPTLSSTIGQVSLLQNSLNNLDGRTATVTVNVQQNGSVPSGINAPALGTAHASGTAHAGGRDFTVGRNETALVNQIGQESRVHNGVWELLPGGPHLQKLDKNDIIFNAAQTADLIRSGRTARRGKVVSSFANGTFGNIDLNNRAKIKWTEANLKKYKAQLDSWGEHPKKGSYSTVLGMWENFGDVDIAFSPFQQVGGKLILLHHDTVYDYIEGLLSRVSQGGDWTTEDLLSIDTRRLIADVGETAAHTSKAMHGISAKIEKTKSSGKKKKKKKKAHSEGTAPDLVGERGMEMYVDPHEGKWHTIGEKGPEFTHLPKDAIVFDAKQTADLMNKGYANTRGTTAFSDGTFNSYDPSVSSLLADLIDDPYSNLNGDAYASGNAYDYPAKSKPVGGLLSKEMVQRHGSTSSSSSQQSTAASNKNTKATEENTKAKKKNTRQTDKNTKKKQEEGEKIDWISSRLSYLSDQTAEYSSRNMEYMSYADKMAYLFGNVDSSGNISATTTSSGKKVTGYIGALIEEIAGNREAAAYYQNYANTQVQTPYSEKEIKKASSSKDKKQKKEAKKMKKANEQYEEYKKMIDNGYMISIDTIKDQNLANQIKEYQNYVEAARSCKKTVRDLNNQMVDLYSTMANAPLEEAQKQISKIEKQLQAVQIRLEGIRQGGSTLNSFYGGYNSRTAASGSYKLLGGAAYRAFKAQNSRKTALMGAKAGVWGQAAGRVMQNQGKFQAIQQNLIQQALDKYNDLAAKRDAAIQANNNMITMQQVKQSGADVAKKYKKKLTKKQIKQLKKGKKVSTKGLKGVAKKAVAEQNKLVSSYYAQNTAAIEAGQKILKKYSDSLTKAQKKALKSGEIVSLKGTSGTLKKKLKAYNKKVKAGAAKTIDVSAIESEMQVVQLDLSDIIEGMQAGTQAFMDAAAEAGAQAEVSAAEAAKQRVQEVRDNFDFINDSFETQISYQETLNKMNEQMISESEAFSNSITAAMRDREKYNVSILRHLKEAQADTLESQLRQGMEKGIIIEGSKEWVEMMNVIDNARNAVHDYDVEIKKIEMQKFDDINNHYNTQIDLLETVHDYYETVIRDAEKFSDRIYPQMRDYQKHNIEIEKQRKQIQADALQAQLDSAVAGGYVEEYTLEWDRLQKQIYDARMAVHDFTVQQKELDIKKIQDIVDHYGRLVDFMQSMADLNNIWYDRDEAINNYKQISYYTTNIASKQAIATKQMQEATEAQKMFNDLTDQGVYQVDSDSYIAKQTEINKLWKTAYDTQNEVAKLEAERIQYTIENFNRVLEKQQTFIDNLNIMAGLINDASMWDFDSGDLQAPGQLSMMIDKQTFDQALADLQKIDKEKNRLFQEFRTNANYGQQAFDENIKELTQQQMEALQDAKSALESFTETVELTAQKQLAALNKVIDKHKEALAKKKDYFDYDKQLRNQNKQIAILEAQSRALADVTDAESKALKARIDAQIKQKREEQDDTIRNHAVELQTNGLTDLQNKLQENYDKWSHEFEASSREQLAVMKSTNMTTTQMANTMNSMLNTFGTNMAQMGTQVSTVNAATTNAVYAVNGKFNAFTRNDTAYSAVQRANDALQKNLTSSLSGPIADVMATKLASIWTTVTTAGDNTMRATLDYTGTTLSNNLLLLADLLTNLPAELQDPLNEISDSIVVAVGGVESVEQQIYGGITEGLSNVRNAVAGAGAGIIGQIGSIGGSLLEAIQQTYYAIQGIDTNKQEEQKKEQTPTDTSTATEDLSIQVEPVELQIVATNGSDMLVMTTPSDEDITAVIKEDTSSSKKKKKKKKKKKAIGSRNINKKDKYLTQENGGEIITTKDGVLIPLEAGDGVIPARLTQKLFQMARNYPNLPNSPSVDVPNIQASGNRFSTTITYGSLLTVNGNVDKEVLPELKQILKQSYEYTQKRMAQDAQKAGMRKRY